MILQETFVVTDALFYDQAVYGHKNQNIYYNANCQETVETDGTGTTIAYTGSSGYLQYRFGQTIATDKPYSIGTKMEFDVVANTSMAIVLNGNSNYAKTLPNSTGKITLTVDSDYITLKQGDTQIAQVSTSNYISDKFSFGFTTNSSGASIKYKEMKIYPI